MPPEECPAPMFGAIIGKGDPMPEEADVQPCKNCGGRHVQIIEEIIVEAPGPDVAEGLQP
jgi:hypothetical protein